MNIEREPLDVIFRLIQPEYVLKSIEDSCKFSSTKESNIGAYHIDEKVFLKFAHALRGGFTDDELKNIYQIVEKRMELDFWCKDESKTPLLYKSIFYLLTNYTKEVLRIKANQPVCCSEKILEWRDISFRLGQDIFTTAHLALHDELYFAKRTYFAWAPIVHNDDAKTRELMKRGVAENHFHLVGSAQNFAISWVCLMNHPEKIYAYFKQKKYVENLDSRLLLSADDKQLPWAVRIQYACWIRVMLFRYLHGEEDEEDGEWEKDELFSGFSILDELRQYVGIARVCHGQKFAQPNGKFTCLDYAITTELMNGAGTENDNFNRILAGERNFLYSCFRYCFSGKFDKRKQDYFYVYLLLRIAFRGELIQVNQRIGFQNFSEYQNRKSDFFVDFPEYWAEVYRVAINGSMKDSGVQSLEARISPQNTVPKMLNTVQNIDGHVLFASRKESVYKKVLSAKKIRKKSIKLQHFYVLHFSKRGWKVGKNEKEGFVVYPRNYQVRKRIKTQAMALAETLSLDNYACERIRGIDACSSEIKCRPETFATEFRFLRCFEPTLRREYLFQTQAQVRPCIAASYHAGEDFMDIADGLRAIDEAVLFLNLRRGDRIGHALALGVDPDIHYSIKQQQIAVTKQDRLDDLIWLLYRSQELDIEILLSLRFKMEREAEELLKDIYREYLKEKTLSLLDYYHCWKLRGNHPELYRYAQNKEKELLAGYLSMRDQYEMHKRNSALQTDERDTEGKYREFLYTYHFGVNAKERGLQPIAVAITLEYRKLIRMMQDAMQRKLIEKGIAIECNPSSNVLIGSFRRYENHPIFRFNRFGLEGDSVSRAYLSVSINTDDQGVFDTSLENEYALLAACMKKQRDKDENRVYSNDAIYHYLNHIREMGIEQIFPSVKDTI